MRENGQAISFGHRLPGLRLDPEAEDVHIHGMIFRSPPNLPVRFAASG